MKRLVGKAVAISAAVGVILLGIFLWGQSLPRIYEAGFYAALEDKYNRLMESKSPKIIVVGGSSAAYGLDSKTLSEAMDMDVVNMGLHAGLGLRFPCETAKKNIQEGDIVLIACEYPAYTGETMYPLETWFAVENRSEFYDCVPRDQIISLLKYYPTYLGEKIDSMRNGTNYVKKEARQYFNSYGDYCEERKDKVDFETYYAVIREDTLDDKIIDYLKGFKKYVEKRGAKVLITFPPHTDHIATTDEEVDAFAKKLERETGIQLISKPQDYFLPEEYFYDSDYHLNDRGVPIRTELLIKDLQEAVEWE